MTQDSEYIEIGIFEDDCTAEGRALIAKYEDIVDTWFEKWGEQITDVRDVGSSNGYTHIGLNCPKAAAKELPEEILMFLG